MTQMLTILYQLASWGCTGFAWTNGAILLWDGFANAEYRVITFAVALFFWMIGGAVFGVERSLSQIYRCSEKTSGEQAGAKTASAWTLLYVCLVFGVLLIGVAMGIGLVAIIGRLQTGFHIFGWALIQMCSMCEIDQQQKSRTKRCCRTNSTLRCKFAAEHGVKFLIELSDEHWDCRKGRSP